MHRDILLLILYITYGVLMSMIITYDIARKRTWKAARNRFLKITETYSLAINDFAGKDVSLERFCDRVFGPEVYYQRDRNSRKLVVAIVLVTIIAGVVLAVINFN